MKNTLQGRLETMGNKLITVVYQDCPLCGDRGKEVKKIVAEKGIRLRKVTFASDEGRQLINEAVFNHGIKKMPFYTDGVRFTSTIAEIIAKPVEKSVEVEKPKKIKRTKKASKK